MTRLSDAKGVKAWLDRLEVREVIVISPHLDDAVFSLAGFLGALHGRAEVVTVFTEGREGHNNDWSRLSGFADSIAEHRARREEDALAMNRLGCRFMHLGFRPGEADRTSIAHALETLAKARPERLDHALVLLPGGAGGPPPASHLSRLLQRIRRRPWGCLPHGEHELIRDLFWQTLQGRQTRLGFYAELPYAWSHSNEDLRERLDLAMGCRTELVEYRHDTSKKVPLVELYQSQLVPIFGTQPAYRRRVLDRAECLLVVQSASLGQPPTATAH